MRILHSHDPTPEDRPLSDEEIGQAITRAHHDRWEWISLGEFELASVCERAINRMLDNLWLRLAGS